MISNFTAAVIAKASKSIVIKGYTVTKNAIGEEVKTYSTKYSFSSIFYQKRNSGLNEKGEKIVVLGDYQARFALSNIGGSIANVTEKDSVFIGSVEYKIEFVEMAFGDHVVLDLILKK